MTVGVLNSYLVWMPKLFRLNPTKDVFLTLMLISYSIAEFCFLLLSSDRGYKPGWVGVGLGKKRQQGVKSSRPVTELPCPSPSQGRPKCKKFRMDSEKKSILS